MAEVSEVFKGKLKVECSLSFGIMKISDTSTMEEKNEQGK